MAGSRLSAHAGVVIDRASASIVVMSDMTVETAATVQANSPSAAVAAALRHIRSSDTLTITTFAPVTQAVQIPMTLDLLAPDRFVHAATAAFTRQESLSVLTPMDAPILTGLLADTSRVRSGAFTNALAVRTPTSTVTTVWGWVPGNVKARTTFMCPPAVACAHPEQSMLSVIVGRAAVHVSASVIGQPAAWVPVDVAGLEDAAGRLGTDGWARIADVWSGGRGDPVADFETRTLIDAIVDAAARVRDQLIVSGIRVSNRIEVVCELSASPLLEAAANARALTTFPADTAVLNGHCDNPSACVSAYRLCLAHDMFSTASWLKGPSA
jgi:hypothetical protein